MSLSRTLSHEKDMFQRFFKSEVSGSVVLLACTILALVWANSPWADLYHKLVHTELGISWDHHDYVLSLGHWVADGLMAIFFFVVGLEIKRELRVGQLSTMSSAALPVVAAFGGAIVPALIYFLLNPGGEGARGWGIPMATDIAFALGILSVFGKRVPIGLKVFLTALAIADDLIAVLVIALFYSSSINLVALGLAAVGLVAVFFLGRLGVKPLWIYVTLGCGVWVAVLLSGIHATIAGVALALMVPVRGNINPREFVTIATDRLAKLRAGDPSKTQIVTDAQMRHALDDLYLAAEDARSPAMSLEHQLQPYQAFFILPLFALFKAGVSFNSEHAEGLLNPISLGIILGLFVGKQIGVTLFAWLVIRSGRAAMPAGVTWGGLWGASCLAGVGFTMAIFISELAMSEQHLDEAKVGILVASVISGVWGWIVLNKKLPRVVPESA